MLILINGSAHLHRSAEGEAIAVSVGSRAGGRYTERVSATSDDWLLEASFEHDSLPGPMTVRAERYRDFPQLTDVRRLFRTLASS